LANWPDGIPAPAFAVQTTSLTCVSMGPSSVCTGLASLEVRTFDVQPGGGWVETPMKPGGSWTCSLIVLALSISLGTRMSSVALAPAGTALAWTLTWASA
jgi:hypothetical protein